MISGENDLLFRLQYGYPADSFERLSRFVDDDTVKLHIIQLPRTSAVRAGLVSYLPSKFAKLTGLPHDMSRAPP